MRHDYVFFPAAWTDTATGTSYESGYYDENGQYYPNVSFSKNGHYENVICHCPYCDQDTLMNPSADEVTSRNLHCPNCGAPMEIRSELDEYRGPSACASAVSAAPRRKRRWVIPLAIVLVLAGLYALGSRELKKEAETQTETFQITEPVNDPDTDLFGQTIHLASSGDKSYAISDTPGDKTLVWDPDVESYYDESSDCWIWYNTGVEPAVWQYWYEGISSDFGDYGWMEHDADGWFIEESYGNWISLPDSYDTGRLWFIED